MNGSDFDLEQQHKHVESKIVASLERISQSFRVLLWQQCKDLTLTPIQVQLLIFLLHHDSKNRKVSYLAEEFNMTKATISDSVKTLEQKELIAKAYEQQDTRSYTINLTDRGREIAQQTSLFTEEIRTPIDRLDPRHKAIVLSSLLDIITHLNKSGIISVQRMCISCSYYQSTNNGPLHFCRLLNQTLAPADLRIDCPEHQVKAF